MSVLSPVAGEDFSIRVISYLPGAVPLAWANTWEVSGGAAVTLVELQAIANALLSFHTALTLSPYIVDRAVISTLAADSEPYNVDNLAVVSWNTNGGRSLVTGDAYDLGATLLVKKVTAIGRHGNLMLRGYLKESDVNSPAGVVQLVSLGSVQTEIDGALTSSGLDDYLGLGILGSSIALITAGTLDNEERAVESLLVKGMSRKKLNNKYFDRP